MGEKSESSKIEFFYVQSCPYIDDSLVFGFFFKYSYFTHFFHIKWWIMKVKHPSLEEYNTHTMQWYNIVISMLLGDFFPYFISKRTVYVHSKLKKKKKKKLQK